jgi:hypothetical protein
MLHARPVACGSVHRMTASLKILIVGGYGIFGGRIVELLEDEPRLTLLIGGRSQARARSFAASRTNASAHLVPVAFDRDADIGQQFAKIRPDLVVDASGPFQGYGENCYRLIEACLAARINYLDLADGSDFVAGVSTFDERARSAGLYILSGVSSFPVLTAAVVRKLSADMATVKTISGGIAPSPYAIVGENVIRAVASYAGKRIKRRRDGSSSFAYPLTEQRRYTVATPGYVPLHNTLFSLMDVPDLQVLPELWPEAEDIWMGAGPQPEVMHRLLTALAWLVRLHLLPTLSPFAALMHFSTNHVRWGEHRGGMFVAVKGTTVSGAVIKRSWHMIAEGDDGPFIPSMAVEAVVRNALQGRLPLPGARASIRDLELEDYEKLFAARRIVAGIRDDSESVATPLYASLLGEALHRLPAPIRAMHDVGRSLTAEGRARVTRGPHLFGRLAATLIGFPKAAADTPVRVQFDVSNEAETWTRTFRHRSFRSRQFAGRGRSDRLLCERFGPLTFVMALVVSAERLSLTTRRWSLFGLPLPMGLCPRAEAYESAEDGRFNFHVKIGHPLTGLIIQYDGWLMPIKAVS